MCALVTGVEMCAHPISAPWVEGCRSRGEGPLGIGDLPHATGILCEGLTQADPGQQAAIGPVDSLLNRGDEGTKGFLYIFSKGGLSSLVLHIAIPTPPMGGRKQLLRSRRVSPAARDRPRRFPHSDTGRLGRPGWWG